MRLFSLTADNYPHGAFSYSFRSLVHSRTNSQLPSWSHSWEDNQKQKVLLLCLWLLGEWLENYVRGLLFLSLFACIIPQPLSMYSSCGRLGWGSACSVLMPACPGGLQQIGPTLGILNFLCIQLDHSSPEFISLEKTSMHYLSYLPSLQSTVFS